MSKKTNEEENKLNEEMLNYLAEESFLNPLYDILKNYNTYQEKKCIFNAISDINYRENFHSDILAYYFSFAETKIELVNWINKMFKERSLPEFDSKNFETNSKAVREEGRRDITIYSKYKQFAIIIENKSNDAKDMVKQIPRYYYALKEQNSDMKIVIIYLNREGSSGPDTSNWEGTVTIKGKDITINKEEVLSHILITDLEGITENVISNISMKSKTARLKGISCEIKDLFENIIGETMENNVTKDLLEFLNKNNENIKMKNSEILSKIVFAYEELPKSMATYYCDYINKRSMLELSGRTVSIFSKTIVYIEWFKIKSNIGVCNFTLDFAFDYEKITIMLKLKRPNKYNNNINKEIYKDSINDEVVYKKVVNSLIDAIAIKYNNREWILGGDLKKYCLTVLEENPFDEKSVTGKIEDVIKQFLEYEEDLYLVINENNQ